MPKAILITESFLNNFRDPKSDNKLNFKQLPKILKSFIEENKDKVYFHFLITKNSSWLTELKQYTNNISLNESYTAATEGKLINEVIKKKKRINKNPVSDILILTYDGYHLIKKQKQYKVQKNLIGLIPFYKSYPKLTFSVIIPLAIGLGCLAVGTVLTLTGVFSPLGAAMALAGVNIVFSSLTTFGLATAGFCGVVGVVSTWIATIFILNVIKTINALKRIFKFNLDNNNEKSASIESGKKINAAFLILKEKKSHFHSSNSNSQKQASPGKTKFDDLDNKDTTPSTPKADISLLKVNSSLPKQQSSLEAEVTKDPSSESEDNFESDVESFHSCASSNKV